MKLTKSAVVIEREHNWGLINASHRPVEKSGSKSRMPIRAKRGLPSGSPATLPPPTLNSVYGVVTQTTVITIMIAAILSWFEIIQVHVRIVFSYPSVRTDWALNLSDQCKLTTHFR